MLIISDLARNDIKEIWSYIAENDVDIANSVVAELSEKFDLLEANPQLGRKRNEFVVNLKPDVIKTVSPSMINSWLSTIDFSFFEK